ncbi:hypothetical protein [Rhabdochromatium marinum]|uniref:hypothetical protein n=1 Tax=Rhabdochromatium marinum TaxID=48729 RepID=UPI001902E2CB|nr:hypothetical protein [Rhabdochromatium marinum]MBK1647611.1 hypothetical protein [Rhabdochromatium marinum]
MTSPAPHLEPRLERLLAEFEQSAADGSFSELPSLDAQLRELLTSDEITQRAAEDADARERLITHLQSIDQVHRQLIAVAEEQRRVLAERVQQLHEDQRAANTYERVRHQSL